jgi:hypothetical protein
MIIGTHQPLIVGHHYERGKTVTDRDRHIYRQPFTVLREATISEWIAQVEQTGAVLTKAMLNEASGSAFYDIAID